MLINSYKIHVATEDMLGESAAQIVARMIEDFSFEGATVDIGFGIWRGDVEPRITVSLVAYGAHEHLVLGLAAALCRRFSQDSVLVEIIRLDATPLAVYPNGNTDDALPDVSERWDYQQRRYVGRSPSKYGTPSAGYKPIHGGYSE